VTVVGNITSVIADHIFVGYADNGAWAGEYDTEKKHGQFQRRNTKSEGRMDRRQETSIRWS